MALHTVDTHAHARLSAPFCAAIASSSLVLLAQVAKQPHDCMTTAIDCQSHLRTHPGSKLVLCLSTRCLLLDPLASLSLSLLLSRGSSLSLAWELAVALAARKLAVTLARELAVALARTLRAVVLARELAMALARTLHAVALARDTASLDRAYITRRMQGIVGLA